MTSKLTTKELIILRAAVHEVSYFDRASAESIGHLREAMRKLLAGYEQAQIPCGEAKLEGERAKIREILNKPNASLLSRLQEIGALVW